jgi:PAS domain S-box-containing protein
MIKNLSIKSRLIVNFFLIAVTLLGIESVSLFGMSTAKDSLKTVYEDRIIALDQLTEIESLILQSRIAITASLVAQTPDEIASNIAKLEKNLTKIDKVWAAYMATYLTPEEKMLAAQFASDRQKFVTQGLNSAAIALRANDLKKTSQIDVEYIRPLYEPVAKGIKALSALQLNVAKQEYEATQHLYDIIRNTIITTAIIGLGFAVWIGFILVRAISRPLEDVVKIARGVAAGNLTQTIEIHSTNEIGQLMKALKEIHDNLIKVIDQARDNEARTRAVLDNVDEGIITINEGGEIEIFNPAAEQIFGYTKHEMIGKNANLLLHGSSQDQRNNSLEHYLQLNKPTASGSSREGVGVRKDGTKFPLEFKTREIQFHTGQLHIVVTRDLTIRKQSEAAQKKHEQVQQRNIELEAANRMKSEFFSTMSHELRTPLNAIIGFSEALKDGLIGDLTGEQRGYIIDILGSGQHQLSLINDILDLSKVEAGKMALHLEPVDLASLLSNSLSMIREKAAAQRIHLNLELAEGLDSIQADARKIKQIVYNLLSNAIKFTAKDGDVILRARRVAHTQAGQLTGRWAGMSLPWHNDKIMDFIEISVTDNGIGIASEDFDLLFTPFSQIDGSLSRKFEGSGLGLTIVKSLAELHGGTVAVESAEGHGTCFTVWLPLNTIEKTITAIPVKPNYSSFPPSLMALNRSNEQLALIADDDPKTVEIITIHLQSIGYRVAKAYSGSEAIEAANQLSPDLVVLDLLMPDVDGFDVVQTLKNNTDTAHIPILIITAKDLTAKDRATLNPHVIEILEKTVSNQGKFLNEVQRALNNSEPGRLA